MKICILGNQARSTYLFWRVLMQHMKEQGHELFCLLPAGDSVTENTLREELGVNIEHYCLDRKGVNVMKDIATFLDLKRVFQKTKPDLLFASTIKPVIYGCLAAKLCSIKNIYATITGLGYAFEANTFFKRIVNKLSIALYHVALSGISGVFFQNHDDAELFRSCGILKNDARVLFARGTGVDTERFAQAPLPTLEQGMVFLLVGRLLEAKGCREYAKAASLIKARYPHARFLLLGPREQGLGSVSDAELASWTEAGVEYLGETKDVRPYLGNAHVLALPSWREGTPTSVMEAMSVGRAAVVTDVPGCREVVEHGKNGFLVPVRNAEALARAFETFLQDPSLVRSMGLRGREMAVRDFDAHVVATRIMDDMHIAGASHD